MTRILRFVCLLLTLAVLGGCSSAPEQTTGTEPQPDASGLAASHGQTPGEGTETEVTTVTGTVLETMDASSYTYAQLDTGTESIWIAATTFPVAVGDRLVAEVDVLLENYHSATLNRDFPRIYFVGRVGREGEPTPAGTSPATPAANAGSPATAGTQASAPVARAEGGTTIAEVWANRATLAGTSATVRGRVVSFNGNILDRNWVHIQDGTGEASDGTHDLTITTDVVVGVGDVVTVTGVVAVDQDFGAGYAYPVLIEATMVSK